MTTIGPLLVDLYSEDANGHPDIQKLVLAGEPWVGVDLKVSQGIYYSSGAWLQKYWAQARSLAGSRYGSTWFRGGYHYMQFDTNQKPKAQAEFFLKAIEKAGGWGPGDLNPSVDVEEANQPAGVTRALVEDYVSEWSLYMLNNIGRRAICYGGSYLRELGITSHMECLGPWVACYENQLPPKVYTSIGYPDWKKVIAWQYSGTDAGVYTAPPGYPKVSPCGHTDISTYLINGGGEPAMEWLRANLPPENPDNA